MVRKFESDLILNRDLSINSAWLRYQRFAYGTTKYRLNWLGKRKLLQLYPVRLNQHGLST
jgi:hypothetical protein